MSWVKPLLSRERASKLRCSSSEVLAVLLLLFFTTPALADPTPAPTPISSPNPSYTVHSINALAHASPSCVRLNFSVTARGTPEHIEVWSHYPTGVFDEVALKGLARWRFKPVEGDAKRVAWQPVFQEFVYDRPSARITRTFLSLGSQLNSFGIGLANVGPPNGLDRNSPNPNLATLIWLCRQPISHGVAVMTPPALTSYNHNPSTGHQLDIVNPAVTVATGLPRPLTSQVVIPIRFCVDSSGVVENTVTNNEHGNTVETARAALERAAFTPLMIGSKAQELCGLTVNVTLYGPRTAVGRKIGEIELAEYDSNHGGPQPPKFLSERAVKISLHIPAGAILPPVAKVDMRFCINKNGDVENPEVVHAKPPKYFNKAAIQTVSGWRFARSSHRICDVYESVKFPLHGR